MSASRSLAVGFCAGCGAYAMLDVAARDGGRCAYCRGDTPEQLREQAKLEAWNRACRGEK